MKRSEINQVIKEMEELISNTGLKLPPFCTWSAQDWKEKGPEYQEIKDNMLGWDVTDYGQGNFDKIGFTLITLRNGNQNMKNKYPKPYAEKLIMLKPKQYSPMHFHWIKMEDIINRGGGNLLIRLYNSTRSGEFADSEVMVISDERKYYVPAGTQIRLTPGESITIYPNLYHDFEVEAGSEAVLIGEVSMCNDDENDNRFYEDVGRFPDIEEDESPYRLLCFEYPQK